MSAPSGPSLRGDTAQTYAVAMAYRRLVACVIVISVLHAGIAVGSGLTAAAAVYAAMLLPLDLYMLVQVFRVAEGTRVRMPWLWVVAMFIPLMGLVCVVALISRGNAWCKGRGVTPTKEGTEGLDKTVFAGHTVTDKLSVMMFLQFFIWGAWYVTVGNYMREHGLAGSIAWAYSLCPIAAIVSPFFLGMVADRFFATERVLFALHVLGGLALLAIPLLGTGSPMLFLAVLGLHALCYTPTLGLTNTLAFHHMKDAQRQFPMVRVFGTIGWIYANFVVSKVFQGDAKPVQFLVAGGAAVLLGLYSLMLPHTPPPAAGKKATAHDIMGLDTLALLKRPAFATFVVSSFLICIPLAFYYAYAPVFVSSVGFANPAFTMSFGQMSEILFMLVMPLCFARLGVKWMLLVGMFAWVARYGLFAGSAAAGAPMLWMVLIGVTLHGICYDFFFVTGQIYVDRAASPQIRGQAQGFLVLITQGVGMLIGAQVAGAITRANTVGETIRWLPVWLIPCVAAGVIMLLFAAIFRENGKKQLADA